MSQSPTEVLVAMRAGSGLQWKHGRLVSQDEETGFVTVHLDDGSVTVKAPEDVRIVRVK